MGVLQPLLSVLLLVSVATAGAAAGAAGAGAAAGNKVLGEKLCCSNITGFDECVKACFDFYRDKEPEKFCDKGCREAYQCETVSGDECPSSTSTSTSEHHSSPDHLVTTDDSAVVVRGAVVEVQAGETLCCSNMTGFDECVEACFEYYRHEEPEKFCDNGCKEAYQCQTVSGDECPSGYHSSSSSHDSSAKGNAAVDHCISGCNSSACNKMLTGVGRKGVVKHAVKRCNNACNKLCSKAGSSTAAAY